MERVPDGRIERGFGPHDFYAAAFATRCDDVACNKSASPDGKHENVQVVNVFQHFECDRSLPGYDTGVVIRMNEQKPALRLDLFAMRLRFGHCLSVQNDFGTI